MYMKSFSEVWDKDSLAKIVYIYRMGLSAANFLMHPLGHERHIVSLNPGT